MAKQPLPEQDTLLKLLHYDTQTGKLFWKSRSPTDFADTQNPEACALQFNNKFAGREAFTSINEDGYRQGWVCRRKHRAHRVIWKMMTGEDPDTVDHIDGQPSNNAWSNLRNVTFTENCHNVRTRRNNVSGVTGVGFHQISQKWRARITKDGRQIGLGSFNTKEEAIRARKAGERRLGFHPNHGRPKAQERK